MNCCVINWVDDQIVADVDESSGVWTSMPWRSALACLTITAQQHQPARLCCAENMLSSTDMTTDPLDWGKSY